MQSISIFSKIIRFFVAFVVAVCLSCFESHADDCVLGTDGCAPEFTVTTTELSAGTTFSFEISAAGTYYIDWGDGGAIEPIVKGTVGKQTITHTYTNAGQYTIGMSGQATLYSTGSQTAAISFKGNTNISGISGSLGAIFGTLTDRVNSDGTLMADAQPRFYNTFSGCSNLSGNIPENLFAGISGAPVIYMFSSTFSGCRGLSGSIPENLFAGIKGKPAGYMFYSTFYNCSGLSGSIPENLFAGINGAPQHAMFYRTFEGCSGLSGSIPEDLFAGIKGKPASEMFSATFDGCSGLSGSIPENLFAGINGAPASYMFAITFSGCSNLSGSIPENLFAGINGAPQHAMFYRTFAGCGGLSGYVPANLFAGIDKTTTASDQMYDVFYNTGLATSCPASTYQYLTGFESDFQGKVACSACPADYPNADSGATSENECYRKCTTDDVAGAHSVMGNNYYGTGVDTCQEAVYYISAGEYLPAGGEEPVDCPSGYYCPGVGDVRWDEKNDQGLVLCPTDFPNSDTGAKTESDCYKPCTTDDVVGAMTVIGTVYYGDGLNTCAVTECMAGWFVKPGLNLAETIGEDAGSNSAYIKNDGTFSEMNYDGKGSKGQEYYGISGPMSFAVDYAGKGILTGHGRCSTQAGTHNNYTWTNPTIVNNLTDETGQSGAQYCYCQVDGFTSVGGTKAIVTSAPWVFDFDDGSADGCADLCASNCASRLRSDVETSLAFRAAVMDATGNIGPGTCEEITYTLNPGEYLPAGGEEPVDCPNGSYCPGAGDVKYDEKNDQGLVVCPSDYPNSDTGAKSENDCYKQCTTDDVVGAMTVVGRNYYGDGTDTCDATECVAGWRLKSGKTLADVIGTEPGINSASVNSMGYFSEVNYDNLGAKGRSYYGLNDNMSFAVDYGERGMVTGKSLCSTKGGTGANNGVSSIDQITRFDELVDETSSGTQYCYCKLDNYTPYGGVKQSVSTPWFLYDNVSACGLECSKYCASSLLHLSSSSFLAQALFNTVKASGDTCEEITYTLNPGEYLPAGGEEPVDCPNGSYCPGAGDVKYDEEKDQGLVACPDGYDNSDSGAKSENDCYKPCTTDDVAGAMTVSGQIYYGSNGNSCIATSCVAGWGVKNFINQIGTEYGLNSAYISTNSQSYGRFYEENFDGDGPKGQAYYGITDLGTFAVDYGENGVITGRGRCSTKPGVFDYDYDTEVLKELTVWDELDDETGQSGANYCYCQVDGYTPVGELTQVLSDMPWVFEGEFWSEFACNDLCAQSCAGYLRANDTYFQEFRSAVFGEPNVCVQESYRMNAGIYLPAGASDAVICPSGSYCPGADSVTKNSNKNQGISECPTEYPYSDAGAVSASNCYKPCTTDDVVNSVSVTGKNYYGDGYDTCAATQCLADWKLQDLYGIVGDTEGLNSAYISTNSSSYGEFRDSAGLDQDYYGISEIGSFAVDYGDTGIITGRARCSTKSGTNNGGTWTNPTRFKELDDESGVVGARYCYCQVDSYTPVGGLTQVLYDMPWVFKEESWSDSGCSEYCAQSCAGGLKSAYTESLAFRSAVFGYASCDEEVYRVNPGDYLPEGEESPSECPSGSFCSGTIGVSSKPDKSQGVSECPSEYPYSDAGAKSESQCYRDCTGDDVANAMTAVGRNYYGDGVDTCIATDCVSGWHVKPGLNLEELVGSTYEGSNSSYMDGTNSAYINNAGDFVEYGQYEEYGQEYYGISENNSFAVIYDDDKGMITGRARCSSQSENSVENLPDESGNSDAYNCYCTIDSYTPVDGTKQTVSAPWIKYGSINWYPGACESNCVQNCAAYMREYMHLDFRGKMFEAAYELPVCSVNQININWNLGYGDNNVSTTTCSYTDVIEYPTDPVRPGYTFTGWKLVE